MSTSDAVSWPQRVHLDDSSIPSLPPPASTRGHARSRTAIEIPPLLPRSPSHSPTRSSTFLPFIGSSRSSSPKRASPSDAAEFSVEDTDSTKRKHRSGRKVDGLASWFEGSSAPVNIGLVGSSKKEEEQDDCVMETMFSGSQESLQPNTSQPQRPTMQSSTSSTSKFGFFSRRSTTVQPQLKSDDIAELDITDILFPDGLPDEICSASFRVLQQNAENALRSLQSAYKSQSLLLKKIRSERNIQADELEASTTRNEHLKAQLLEMADRSAEQEKLTAALKSENEQLKANETALRSIRVITDHTSLDNDRSYPTRRNRASDMSFAESINSAHTQSSSADSVFSHDEHDLSRSPGTSVGCPSPTLKHACRVTTPHIQANPAAEHLKSLTTNIVSLGCNVCHGRKPQEAWEVVSMLKAENTGLKEQIMMLEKSHENAIDYLTWDSTELNDLTSKCQRMLSVRGVHDDD